MTAPAPRAHLASVPVYIPGRSAAEAMAEHGISEAVKLASNEVPFGPLPGVAEALAGAVSDTARYADHDSDVLAERYAGEVGLTRAHVAVGPGSVGLLQQLTLAYAGPDDQVLYPWPSFIAYPQFSGVVAADRVVVPLRRCSIDVDAVLGAITPRTRVVFIANPNNPISGALRTDELRRLLDGAPADCLVVVDEAYREFVTGADVPDALQHLAEFPNLVVLRTLSKAYGMAGLRVGFLIADPVVVSAVYATMIPFAVNGPAQAAAMVALDQQAEVRRRCAVIVAERQRGAQELRRRGLGVPESQGNFWWLPAGERAADITVALEQRGVVVRPFPTGIRVTVGLPEENEAFLHALDAVLADDPSRTGSWTLPTGARAMRTADLLDDVSAQLAGGSCDARALDRVAARLAELGADDWALLDTGVGPFGDL
ncbi:MAG: histidinol-phosphate aminotransferase, partial [Ilumatobacteraceae bacterium]|nr:histidinol-phosphate aminotransferase [Ilumatobacteraceae bacterium]